MLVRYIWFLIHKFIRELLAQNERDHLNNLAWHEWEESEQ